MKHLRLFLASVLLLAAGPSLQAAPFTLRSLPAGFTGPLYDMGGYCHYCFLAADFTGSGRLQLYAGGSVISKFPDTGTITLPALSLPQWAGATVKPIGCTVLDADGDGDLDIFRLNEWNGYSDTYTMQVFLNNGSGTFTTGWREDWTYTPTFYAGLRLYKLAVGDFDNDGDVDIAMRGDWEHSNTSVSPTVSAGSLAIRWNDGSGGFAAATSLLSQGLNVTGTISAGDIDRDGDLDLVSTNEYVHKTDGLYSTYHRLFYNNGSGGFSSKLISGDGLGSLADVDGDGWLDLTQYGRYMSNAHPAGGSFGVKQHLIGSPSTVMDVDGDGWQDMVGGALFDGTKLAYRKRLSQSWDAEEVIASFADYLCGVDAADVDADGDTDLLVTLDNGSRHLLENTSLHYQPDLQDGTPDFLTHFAVNQIECADFNQDGRDDIMSLSTSQGLSMMAGAADGTPTAAGTLGITGGTPGNMAVGDYDRDGLIDVAFTMPAAGEVRMARNNGGAISTWSIITVATGIPGVTYIATGEAGTANGQADMLVSSATTGQLRWIFRNIAGAWSSQTIRSTVSPAPSCLLAANASARPGDEPFCLAASGGSLSVKRFELNPGWTEIAGFSQTLTASPYNAGMVWADTNGDSDKELVLVNGTGALAYWAPQAGNSTTQFMATSPSAIRRMAATDWDRDGRDDILCATATGLSLYRGGNSWQRMDLQTSATGYNSVKTPDINGDGFPDIAAHSGNAVYFFRNAPRVLRPGAPSPASVSLPSGNPGTAFQIVMNHPGRAASFSTSWLNDVPVKITGAHMEFRRADQQGGTWVPGAALTSTELAELVHSVSLTIGNATVGSSGPGLIGSNGMFAVTYNSLLGTLVPLHAGSWQAPAIRLNLKPTAHNASRNRFFLIVTSLEADTTDERALVTSVPLTADGSPLSTLVTITPDYSPIQLWRIAHFGTPQAMASTANEADYDSDGVPNLAEYALGTNPAAAEPALNGTNALTLLPGITSGQALKFRLYTGTNAFADPKLRLTIQQSTSLGNWSTLAQRTGSGTWSGLSPQFAIPSGGFTVLTFQSAVTPQNTKQFFLRLKAEELP